MLEDTFPGDEVPEKPPSEGSIRGLREATCATWAKTRSQETVREHG
jgi:hypothetical protein